MKNYELLNYFLMRMTRLSKLQGTTYMHLHTAMVEMCVKETIRR